MLLSNNGKVGRYKESYVYEPKKRLVMALPFKDRVVQWAMYRVIYPIYERGFISHSYGCIRNRGTHAAAKQVNYWMRLLEHKYGRAYYLKLDISKFFYRVDQDVLLNIIQRKFDDDGLLWLASLIIKSEDTPFGLPAGYNPGETDLIFDRGMPVGNLSSQLFANIYLNEVDQFVKRKLGVKYYIRYMDDMIVFSEDKQLLHKIKSQIQTFLETNLNLHLNDKTAIRPTTLGVDFCGYHTWSTHRRVRKSTALTMRRRLRKLQKDYATGKITLDRAMATVHSYQGILQHCNSYNLRRTIFGEHIAESPGWFFLQRDSTIEAATE